MSEKKIYDASEANSLFQNDRYAMKTSGIVAVEVGEDFAKCRMDIDDRHLNANNVVMGGAIYTLADFTFAVASNYNTVPTVTLSSQIQYIGAARGKTLYSELKMIKNGKRNCFCEITVTDENENRIAFVTTVGAHLV